MNVTKIRKKSQFNIYTWIVAPISIALSIYSFFYCANEKYIVFAFLPLLYGVLLLVFFHFNNRNGLAFNIISIVMFLRYVITVAMTLLSAQYGGFSLRADNYGKVFGLMVYEMLIVFLVMFFYNTRNKAVEYASLDCIRKKGNIIRYSFFAVFFLVMLFAVLFYPSARNVMFNFSFAAASEKRVTSDRGMTGFIFVFFKIGLNVTYGLIMTAILKLVKHKNMFLLIFCLVISAIFISCNWTGGGSISRWGLVTSTLVSLIVLTKSFPKYKKSIFIIVGVTLGVIILLSSVIKVIEHHAHDTESALNDIFTGSYFSEYFQGFVPVSNALKVIDKAKDQISFTTFLDDVCSAYPWINKLFYEPGNLTETIYLNAIHMNDKIIATIVQGYAHFGVIGAPIFSGLLTYIALKCDDIMRKTDDIFIAIPISQIAVWCSLFMAVNVYIIQRTTMYFVLLLLVLWLDKKFRL